MNYKITFLGDIMCKSQMIDAYRTENSYNFDIMFDEIRNYFTQSSLVMANLETPVSINDEGLTEEEFRFNSPIEFAASVKKAGIDVVATANNHCIDRGVEGLNSTIDSLNAVGLKHTGISNGENEALIIDVGEGVRIGVLSYTYGTNAFSNHEYLIGKNKTRVNLFQNQELSNPLTRYCYYNRKTLLAKVYNKLSKFIMPNQWSRPIYERKEFSFHCMRKLGKDIKYMKSQNPDIIVCYMHIGGQYNEHPTNYTLKMADYLLKAGVNIVVGSHEHVVHGGIFNSIADNKVAAYSLGNFDGVAGVYAPPYDKMAEYSVIWNVYIRKNEGNAAISRTTFSVIKTIHLGNQIIQVVPVYDLISRCESDVEKNKLEKETLIIAEKFSGKAYSKVEKEFEI